MAKNVAVLTDGAGRALSGLGVTLVSVISGDAIWFVWMGVLLLCAVVVVAVPLIACVWREGGYLDRRRQRR